MSVGYVAGWLRGEAGGSWLTFAADVRDVARAHVLAALHPAAPGQRYVVARPAASSPSEVAALLSARFPGLLIPAPGAAALAAPPPAHPVDASKVARELGLALRPLAETLADAAVAVIRLGLAVPWLREPPPAEAADGAAAAPRA